MGGLHLNPRRLLIWLAGKPSLMKPFGNTAIAKVYAVLIAAQLFSQLEKSLLTGAAPGWHPPKAHRFIRRITFRKDDPVAMACMDYGYTIVPSQSDKDDEGRLLNDPFDPRCTEWLVEIPTEVSWANLPM